MYLLSFLAHGSGALQVLTEGLEFGFQGLRIYYGIMGIYYMGIMEKRMEATIMGYIGFRH